MEVELSKNIIGSTVHLSVDGYHLLSKREFIKELSKIEGVLINSRSLIFNVKGFCRFEFKGESFTVFEDSHDYWFFIESEMKNYDLLKPLETHFKNLHIKKRCRLVSWFSLIALLLLIFYINSCIN